MRVYHWMMALSFAALLSACGAAVVEGDRSPDERLQQYATVLDQLKTHPQASRVEVELGQASTWLRRAEAMATKKDRDDDQYFLMLDVVDGQLVRTKTALSRFTAEAELDTQRATYEAQMGSLQAARDEAARLRGQGDTQEVQP